MFLSTSNEIQVFDVSNAPTLLGGLPTGYSGYSDTRFSPDGNLLYFAGTKITEVFDLQARLFTNSVPLPVYAQKLAVSRDGGRLVVVGQGPGPHGSTLSLVDPGTRAVTRTVSIPGLDVPYDVALRPDGRRAYLAGLNADSGTVDQGPPVFAVDLDGGAVTRVPVPKGQVAVLDSTAHLALSPDGARLYVGHSLDTVVLDTATNAVLAHIDAPPGAGDLVVAPSGRWLYQLDGVDGTIQVYSADGNHVSSGRSGPFPKSPRFSADGRRLYLLTQDKLVIVDTADFS